MKQQHHAKAKMNNVCGPKMKQQHGPNMHGKAKMNNGTGAKTIGTQESYPP